MHCVLMTFVKGQNHNSMSRSNMPFLLTLESGNHSYPKIDRGCQGTTQRRPKRAAQGGRRGERHGGLFQGYWPGMTGPGRQSNKERAGQQQLSSDHPLCVMIPKPSATSLGGRLAIARRSDKQVSFSPVCQGLVPEYSPRQWPFVTLPAVGLFDTRCNSSNLHSCLT